MSQLTGHGTDQCTNCTFTRIHGMLKTTPELSLTAIVSKLGGNPKSVPEVAEVHRHLTVMCSSGTLIHAKEGDTNVYRLSSDPQPA